MHACLPARVCITCVTMCSNVLYSSQSKHAEELSAERLLNEKEKEQLESKIQKEKINLELELENERQRMKYELKLSEVGIKLH